MAVSIYKRVVRAGGAGCLVMLLATALGGCASGYHGYIPYKPSMTRLESVSVGQSTYADVIDRLGEPAEKGGQPGKALVVSYYYGLEASRVNKDLIEKGNYSSGCKGCGTFSLIFDWRPSLDESLLRSVARDDPALRKRYRYALALVEMEAMSKAMDRLHELASRHFVPAQTTLGMLYLEAEKGWQDERAYELLRSSANNGDAQALYGLGLMYRDGRAVEQNHRAAAAFFDQAAGRGHREAALALARMLEDIGESTLAQQYYQKAREAEPGSL